MSSDPRNTSEQRLRAAIDSAPSGLLMVDEAGRIVLVNREVERLFGYPREELLGRPIEQLIPERFSGNHPTFRKEFTDRPSVRMMGHGRELFGRRKDGSEVPVEIGLTPVVTDEGMFVLSSIVDITARRKADARFRAAVESAPSGMIMVDSTGKILLVNREIERLFGYARDELLGRSVDLLVPERLRTAHPGFREGFHASPHARPMGAGRELFGLRKDGSEVPVEIGLNPIETDEGLFILSSVVDISARVEAEKDHRRLEGQLRQAQKMEAVGTLAGGIAHDFNNILNGILGYAELALARATEVELVADLGEVVKAATRGRDLVGSILRFSRNQESTRLPTDLSKVVSDSLRLLRPTLPATIRMRPDLGSVPARALADPTAVEQVVMNLATNAAHAMSGAGEITIALEQFYARDSFVRLHPELREGRYVVLRVTDTGPGIEPAILDRVLEPFFTTKPPGSGSGLGLAMVHGIMKQHEGTIELESRPGAGTTVRCLFPLIEESPAATDSDTEVLPRGRGERILFLDDEPSLAKLGERRLGVLGYQVTAATSAEEALACLRTGSFDLIVTDFTMPGITGMELAQRIRDMGLTMPIILLTGMSAELVRHTAGDTPVTMILGKPVTVAQLAGGVRTLLDRASKAKGQ